MNFKSWILKKKIDKIKQTYLHRYQLKELLKDGYYTQVKWLYENLLSLGDKEFSFSKFNILSAAIQHGVHVEYMSFDDICKDSPQELRNLCFCFQYKDKFSMEDLEKIYAAQDYPISFIPAFVLALSSGVDADVFVNNRFKSEEQVHEIQAAYERDPNTYRIIANPIYDDRIMHWLRNYIIEGVPISLIKAIHWERFESASLACLGPVLKEYGEASSKFLTPFRSRTFYNVLSKMYHLKYTGDYRNILIYDVDVNVDQQWGLYYIIEQANLRKQESILETKNLLEFPKEFLEIIRQEICVYDVGYFVTLIGTNPKKYAQMISGETLNNLFYMYNHGYSKLVGKMVGTIQLARFMVHMAKRCVEEKIPEEELLPLVDYDAHSFMDKYIEYLNS